MSHYWRGVLLVLLSAVSLGTYGVWSKLLGPTFPPLFQGWVKALMIAIVLLPYLAVTNQIQVIQRKDWFWISVFLVSTSCTLAPLYYAFNALTLGSALLLFYSSMLLTMYGFGILFFKEERTWTMALSLTLALLGLITVFSFSFVTFAILGVGMAILNGVASGTEVSASKHLSGAYSTIFLSWLAWVAIAITNAIVGLWIGEPLFMPAFDLSWAYLFGFAIASFLGFWGVMEGIKYLDATTAGLIGLTEIIFGLAFAWLLFSEALTLQTAIGAVLILTAAALPSLQEVYNKRKTI
jgi:drug/metabolite transporter (DMT)-like permease